MADPPTTTTLAQLIAASLLALVGGITGARRWDRWRDGGTGRDARHIIEAIDRNGLETRDVMRKNAKAIADLRLALAEKRCPYARPQPPEGG